MPKARDLLVMAVVAAVVSVVFSQDPRPAETRAPMIVQYLEIVTPDVDAVCAKLERIHNVRFSEPVAEFGNARTAALAMGGKIGVRAPMRQSETPVVRPYLLVDNIEVAVKDAADQGAEIALPPMEIPGGGTFAIYIQGGIQFGLWQKVVTAP